MEEESVLMCCRIAFLFPSMVMIVMFAVSWTPTCLKNDTDSAQVNGSKFSNSGTESVSTATQSGFTMSYFAIIFGSSSDWAPVSGRC